jgi:hypothetical protein
MRALTLSLSLLGVLLAAAACENIGGRPAPPTAPTPSTAPSPAAVEIVTAPEGQPYRESITAGGGQIQITWIEPRDAGSDWQESARSREAVLSAIRGAAPALAGLDYASLSLPDFVTPTRGFKPAEPLYHSGDVAVDAFGQGSSSSERYVLYLWQGPELPQHPERPLVHRWVRVYALYDLASERVARLLATIGGEVQE